MPQVSPHGSLAELRLQFQERILEYNHVLPISLPLFEMDFAQSFRAVQYREASRS
jgi:hypothetical protein